MAVRAQFSWDGIVDGRTTRRIRKGLAQLASPARVSLARQAMTAVGADLPVDDELVTRYYGYFRVGQVVDEPAVSAGAYPGADGEEIDVMDDPLNVRQGDYWDVWDRTGSVEDFRRQQAIETLSWAVMLADGDDPGVNYPSVEQTINHAVITLTHDAARRQALVEQIRTAVDSG